MRDEEKGGGTDVREEVTLHHVCLIRFLVTQVIVVLQT